MKKRIGIALALAGSSLQGTPITFIAPTQITAGSFTISSPGYYQLLDDTTFSGAAATNAIAIASDNVTLDLNGKKLISGNTNATNAINITSAAKNIIIQNGIIDSFVTTGVKVDTATSYTNIVLSDLAINGRTGASTSGISWTRVFNSAIRRCAVTRETNGGVFTTCDNIAIADSAFNHCFSRGISASTCNNFLLTNCAMNGSVTNGAIGMNMTSCFAFTFTGCFFNNNVSTGASGCFGANMNTSRVMAFYNCEFVGNKNSSTADSVGLSLFSSSGIYAKDTLFVGNSTVGAGNSRGLFLQSSHGNIFENCIAADNMAGGAGMAAGFNLDSTSTNNLFVECQSFRNSSTSGISRGYSLVSSTTANVLRFCEAYDNTGGGANTGFSDSNAGLGSNMYYGCAASKNGTDFSSSIPFATWSLSGGTFATAVTNLPESFYNVAIVA